MDLPLGHSKTWPSVSDMIITHLAIILQIKKLIQNVRFIYKRSMCQRCGKLSQQSVILFTFVQIDYHVGCRDDDNGDLTCIPELSLVSQDLQDSGLTLSFFLKAKLELQPFHRFLSVFDLLHKLSATTRPRLSSPQLQPISVLFERNLQLLKLHSTREKSLLPRRIRNGQSQKNDTLHMDPLYRDPLFPT